MLVALNVVLITGRTISQGVAREGKKLLKEYVEAAAVCELDPGDMEKLGIRDGDTVKIKTTHGSVIVKGKVSTQAPHPGIAFMPLGPWANEIISSETGSIGMPYFKGIAAEIETAPEESVLGALDIIKRRGTCQQL